MLLPHSVIFSVGDQIFLTTILSLSLSRRFFVNKFEGDFTYLISHFQIRHSSDGRIMNPEQVTSESATTLLTTSMTLLTSTSILATSSTLLSNTATLVTATTRLLKLTKHINNANIYMNTANI